MKLQGLTHSQFDRICLSSVLPCRIRRYVFYWKPFQFQRVSIVDPLQSLGSKPDCRRILMFMLWSCGTWHTPSLTQFTEFSITDTVSCEWEGDYNNIYHNITWINALQAEILGARRERHRYSMSPHTKCPPVSRFREPVPTHHLPESTPMFTTRNSAIADNNRATRLEASQGHQLHGTVPYVRYGFLLVSYSNYVRKMHSFWDIRLQ